MLGLSKARLEQPGIVKNVPGGSESALRSLPTQPIPRFSLLLSGKPGSQQGFGEPGSPPYPSPPAAASDEELQKQQQEAKEEEDDEEALRKARDWDDWKDTHPRGYGNRHNMG